MSFRTNDVPRAVAEASKDEEFADYFDVRDVKGSHIPNTKHSITKDDFQIFLDSMENYIDVFARNLLTVRNKPVEITPKQMDVVNVTRNCQFGLFLFNRQGGKSFIVAVDEIHEDIYAEDDTEETIIYAPIKKQADIIFGHIRKFIKGNNILMGFTEEFTKELVQFRNGNKITVLSASDQSHVRGFSPTKIRLDESQDISDRVYHEDIKPSGSTTNARVFETGTPAGKNHFHDTFIEYQKAERAGKTDMRVVTQTYLESPLTNLNYVNTMKATTPKASFDQEFLLKWNFDVGNVWRYLLLKELTTINCEEPYIDGQEYYAGIDIGKSPAETVVSIGKKVKLPNDKFSLNQIYLNRIGDKSYARIIDEIEEDLNMYNPVVACVDYTGVGTPVYDLLDEKIDYLEPITYNNELKAMMVDEFTILAEQQPQPGINLMMDEEQTNQFEKFTKKKLPSGRFRYKHEKGYRDDIVNAVILMVHGHNLWNDSSSEFALGTDMSAGTAGSNLISAMLPGIRNGVSSKIDKFFRKG